MAFVSGVGGGVSAEPVRLAEANGRPRRLEPGTADANGQDGVRISDDARQASEVQRFVEAAKADPEVRQERVEQARAQLEQGVHSVNDVLEAVAGRLSRYVSGL